ncbi:MAG TPA: rhomboid family intramembrane serine protease [Candidatus Aquabacterium excrementipullorum]|nr:rhomboid family intramembrane serine protease [Candidatus Aquabacterium excrementipullorum]
MPPLPPITQAIILLNVALYCIDIALGGLLTYWTELWPVTSPNFMPWQVVSYAFMHGSITHLGLNMLGLWMFGGEMERLWGPKRYLQFYAAGALAAAAFQLVISLLAGWGNPMVGASGALFALLMAFGMTFPDRTILLLIPPIPIKAKYLVMIYGVIELYQGVSGTQSGVAHFAHLGGMLGGWLMLRYWGGKPPFPPRTRGSRGRF